MSLVAAIGATAPVFHLVNAIQKQINPANPAITYAPSGQGTERRRKRELAKAKANKLADAERKKRMAKKASVVDVELVEMADGNHYVSVFGTRVGTIKKLGDKHVLFNNAADEVGERARARDLKKAAAALYVGKPEVKMSRQVRRCLQRKGMLA